MPENKRLRYDKPKATVCKGAASGPLRPLPKVSNLVKTFNKKAIIKSGEAGGKRRGVQKERGFIGGRLSVLVSVRRVRSRTSSVQTLTPCRSSGSSACPALCSAASETGFCRRENEPTHKNKIKFKKKEEMNEFWRRSERIRGLPHLCSRSVA